MIIHMWNPEKIWHQKLLNLPTSPVSCSHITLGNPKNIFNTTNTYFWLFAFYLKIEQTVTTEVGKFSSLWCRIFSGFHIWKIIKIYKRRLALKSRFLVASCAYTRSSFFEFIGGSHGEQFLIGEKINLLLCPHNLSSSSYKRSRHSINSRLFGFLKVKWLQLTGEVDKFLSFWCQIYSGFYKPKII